MTLNDLASNSPLSASDSLLSFLSEGGKAVDHESLKALIEAVREEGVKDFQAAGGGVRLAFNQPNSLTTQQLAAKIKPKVLHLEKSLSIPCGDGPEHELIEGENLSALVSLYKYRGKVDLILTDPPYNTGKDFRYNDKWDTDPDDAGVGDLVREDDGSRHAKWLRFMATRLHMMKKMLTPRGVIAICIDVRELYRLGCLMDEVFGENNRIALINWQKNHSPKSDSKGVSVATEYVLVYANDINQARTHLLPRTEKMDAAYGSPDGDPYAWSSGDPMAPSGEAKYHFGIQSPFTGEIHYPRDSYWRSKKSDILEWMNAWGSAYVEKDIGDRIVQVSKSGKQIPVKALVIDGVEFLDGEAVRSEKNEQVLGRARERAEHIRQTQVWPKMYFGSTGQSRPRLKNYLVDVRQGRVPLTYWEEDHYAEPLDIGCVSWAHGESGTTRSGAEELDAVIGRGHGFDTVKPLKLIKKIIQLWCPPDGVVLDPFAGSGTTGQAVLEMNKETGAHRQFVLIEQGNNSNGDHYAKTLTAERLRRVITGEWVEPKKSAPPVPVTGEGFRYIRLGQKIDADAVAKLHRQELVDLMLLTHRYDRRKGARLSIPKVISDGEFLFAVNEKKQGYFLVWKDATVRSSAGAGVLDKQSYEQIMREVVKHGLDESQVHVYAQAQPGTASSNRVVFHKIPDDILRALGCDIHHSEVQAA